MESIKLLFHIVSLVVLCFTRISNGAETLSIYDPNSDQDEYPLAISVSNKDLSSISSSILMAETWLRTHVLTIYPSSKITHIVVGHNLLCFSQPHFHDLILPTLENLHHALTRWGLEREINVSPSLSSHCLTPNLTFSLIKPILSFIQITNSTYLVNQLDKNPKTNPLFTPHFEFLKKIGSLPPKKMNFVIEEKPPNQRKLQINPTMRKLSFALPPLVGSDSFPVTPFSSAPGPSYTVPCSPTVSPAPVSVEEKLWCVAKPSVPVETLQEAMDYACGEGGGDCEEIQPNGKCYNPETIVAHASFAFNSYWQVRKNNGGTCSFGGTAMLINSDPSFLHCRFVVI